MTIRFKTCVLQLIAVCLTSLSAAPAWSDDWVWSITPYVWGISADLDTELEEPPPGTAPGAEMSDLLDKFDFGIQLHLEGRKDRFGFLVDYTNLQLSDRVTRRNLEIDTDSETNLLEAAGVFALFEGDARTELMAGIRALDVELELEIERIGAIGPGLVVSGEETLIDAMIGIRYLRPLSEKWNLALRGDIASGDTDFSWNVSATVGRRFGERSSLILSYRYLNVAFEDEDDLVNPELAIYGPQIGYMFHF